MPRGRGEKLKNAPRQHWQKTAGQTGAAKGNTKAASCSAALYLQCKAGFPLVCFREKGVYGLYDFYCGRLRLGAQADGDEHDEGGPDAP